MHSDREFRHECIIDSMSQIYNLVSFVDCLTIPLLLLFHFSLVCLLSRFIANSVLSRFDSTCQEDVRSERIGRLSD